uniref:Ribonucleoside-triphosphate reductase n=1 Tax=Vibrio phage Vc1 TaxID=1480731 RepID=A0A6M5CCS6_9CAUD
MDYNYISQMATDGIAFFSDDNGDFECITQQGSVEIVNGVEVEKPEIKTTIHGLVRAPRTREIDGDRIIATDKLGVFNNAVELKTDITLSLMVSDTLSRRLDQSGQQAQR